MPAALNACTHAPTIMIGEKGAELIAGGRLKRYKVARTLLQLKAHPMVQKPFGLKGRL